MMIFQYHFVLIALLLCLVLSGMLTYFGYHVVRRGVIFVDLSLAQVAALGSSVGILLGYADKFPVQNYLISLAFTLIGATLFVMFRQRKERVPVEALIGITYAAAIALSLIVLEKTAEGTEALKEMLAGSILTISPKELIFVSALCTITTAIHWFSRKKLFMVTNNPEESRIRGIKIWWWDFVFYTTFGFVVTSSVKITGVLLVFAFLIMPTVAAMIATEGTSRRILFGCLFGFLGCILGLEMSLRLDWSPAPTIVVVFLILLVITWLSKKLIFNRLKQ